MSEGGKITRIILGESNWTSRGNMNIIATKGDVTFTANKKVNFYGVEEGIHIGDYDFKEEQHEIAFSGWWSPDYEGIRNLESDSRGPKSSLGKTVYYQLTVSQDIPVGTSITFQLWDKDTLLFLDFLVQDDYKFGGKKVYRTANVREVNGKHRITIELFLNPNWNSDLVSDMKGYFKDGRLDFYWTWEYNNKPWTSNTNLLSVYTSETTLFIKPAYEGYGFPEVRSADGEIIVFSAGIVATKESSKELENVMNKICDNIKSNAMFELREKMVKYSDKLSYSIAIKQLKKGHLVNNMGKLEYSRRIYTKPVFDNGGELYEITQAANFGYRKEGKFITTKGISQLDYFKQVGVRNAILKNAEKLNFFINCLDTIKFGMDGKMETLITMFVPLDFLNAVVYPSISKPIEEVWDNIVVHDVEQAKDNGLRGIYNLSNSEKFNRDRYGDYKYIEINQDMLNKLLDGRYKTFEELEKNQIELRKNMDKYKYQESLSYTILYYKKNDENVDKLMTYIETIFIN